MTSELVKTCQSLIGVETCMHLTCTNMPAEKVDIALRVSKTVIHCDTSCPSLVPSRRSKVSTLNPVLLGTITNLQSQEAKLQGCRNILALRGDPPAGQDTWTAVEGGFTHGIDLIRHIRKHHGDYFEIAIAGFPQHVTLPPQEFAQELQWLKEKIEAGASIIFTQMFYNVQIFIDWVTAVRKAGITVPIVPGINPIQTWNGFLKSTKLAETPIPQSYLDTLEPHKANDEKVRELGTQLVVKLCRDILDSGLGIRGLHFYTMNLERGTRMLLEQLQFVPRVEAIKPLPWRQSLTPSRRMETIRPIFWANRTKSYLSRTESWDEYPNGRFGDSRSPAYGEIPYDIKLPVDMPIFLRLYFY